MAYFIKAGFWREARKPVRGELDLSNVIDSSSPVSKTGFDGEFSLSSVLGTYWEEITQSAALVLSEGPSSILGGTDLIKITANGDTITVPGEWINVGSASISTVDGDINRIIVTKTFGEIWYTVVVES